MPVWIELKETSTPTNIFGQHVAYNRTFYILGHTLNDYDVIELQTDMRCVPNLTGVLFYRPTLQVCYVILCSEVCKNRVILRNVFQCPGGYLDEKICQKSPAR